MRVKLKPSALDSENKGILISTSRTIERRKIVEVLTDVYGVVVRRIVYDKNKKLVPYKPEEEKAQEEEAIRSMIEEAWFQGAQGIIEYKFNIIGSPRKRLEKVVASGTSVRLIKEVKYWYNKQDKGYDIVHKR